MIVYAPAQGQHAHGKDGDILTVSASDLPSSIFPNLLNSTSLFCPFPSPSSIDGVVMLSYEAKGLLLGKDNEVEIARCPFLSRAFRFRS